MIAPVGAVHAAVLAALHADAFPPAERWTQVALAEQLVLPGCFALLHPEGGFVLARTVLDEAEILTLAVAHPVRRRGLAGQLMTRAMACAAVSGAGHMFLEVAEDNAPARGLYARLGFQPAGRRTGYYPGGRDALVLRAPLSPCAAAAP